MSSTNLQNKKCIPCTSATKPLDKKEIDILFKQLKAWKLIEDPKTGFKLEKNYTFVDFKHAVGFINEVGDVAEYEGHHPNLNLHDWNKVTVTFYTHAIKGLSENDFIMAAKVDQVLQDNKE